jgi:hypothetical protein
MLRLISDEDVHDDIVRGLRRREDHFFTVYALAFASPWTIR